MKDKENKKLVPELRFSEFEETGDWDTMQLGDACSLRAGKFVKASEINEQAIGSV